LKTASKIFALGCSVEHRSGRRCGIARYRGALQGRLGRVRVPRDRERADRTIVNAKIGAS
jgi:hypothetical protein